jgi:hypothetical protein
MQGGKEVKIGGYKEGVSIAQKECKHSKKRDKCRQLPKGFLHRTSLEYYDKGEFPTAKK